MAEVELTHRVCLASVAAPRVLPLPHWESGISLSSSVVNLEAGKDPQVSIRHHRTPHTYTTAASTCNVTAIQGSLSIEATIGTQLAVLYRQVSLNHITYREISAQPYVVGADSVHITEVSVIQIVLFIRAFGLRTSPLVRHMTSPTPCPAPTCRCHTAVSPVSYNSLSLSVPVQHGLSRPEGGGQSHRHAHQ